MKFAEMTLSNYPPGCTTRDLPGWGYGVREYDYECTRCLSGYDASEGQPTRLAGEGLCPACRECCALGCGEWIDDETAAQFGPPVRVRDPRDGKVCASHAECAASYLLGCEITEETTREQIAMAVYRAGDLEATCAS